MEFSDMQRLGAVMLPQLGAPAFLKAVHESELIIDGRQIIWVESRSFLKLMQTEKTLGAPEIGPFSAWSKQQQERVIRGLLRGPAGRLEMAFFNYRDKRDFGFTNGEHRTRAMIDFGAEAIPFDVDNRTAECLRRDNAAIIVVQSPSRQFITQLEIGRRLFQSGRIMPPYTAVSFKYPLTADAPIREVIAVHEHAAELLPWQAKCEEACIEVYKKFGLEGYWDPRKRGEWNVPEFWNSIIYALKSLKQAGAVSVPYVEGMRFSSNPEEFSIDDIARWHEAATAKLIRSANNGPSNIPDLKPR